LFQKIVLIKLTIIFAVCQEKGETTVFSRRSREKSELV
jgi:hypothetical protein